MFKDIFNTDVVKVNMPVILSTRIHRNIVITGLRELLLKVLIKKMSLIGMSSLKNIILTWTFLGIRVLSNVDLT